MFMLYVLFFLALAGLLYQGSDSPIVEHYS
jgi:hypothetical protein